MTMKSVTLVLGNGDPKKHSVRMEPLSTDHAAIAPHQLTDFYVPRRILDALGARDTDRIILTFTRKED